MLKNSAQGLVKVSKIWYPVSA